MNIVSIELKQAGDYYPELEQKVVDLVRRMDMVEQVYIISFDQYSVVKVKQLCPEVEVGVVICGNFMRRYGKSEPLTSRCRSNI